MLRGEIRVGEGVADDEVRAVEPTSTQPAQEAEPSRVGLRADGREAEYAAHAIGVDADGGDDRRGLHAAVPPALDVGGVQEQVRHLDSARVAGRQLADLGVERPAHGADLVLRDPLYAHLPGDTLHLAHLDAVRPRLRDGRRDGLVGARVALDYPLGEVGACPQLGYAQDDVADGGHQAPLAVATARGGPVPAGHVGPRAPDLVHNVLQERAS